MADFDPLYDCDGSEEEIAPTGCALAAAIILALWVAGGIAAAWLGLR